VGAGSSAKPEGVLFGRDRGGGEADLAPYWGSSRNTSKGERALGGATGEIGAGRGFARAGTASGGDDFSSGGNVSVTVVSTATGRTTGGTVSAACAEAIGFRRLHQSPLGGGFSRGCIAAFEHGDITLGRFRQIFHPHFGCA
jgi:hypothetical protein